MKDLSKTEKRQNSRTDNSVVTEGMCGGGGGSVESGVGEGGWV